MSDEIKEILDYMKQYVENIYEHDSEPMLNWKDLKKLLDYITNLQEKNNNLKEDFKRHIDRINELTERNDNLQQENDRLNNIINELEKWVDEYPSEDVWYEHIINKLKELKENNRE